MAAGLGVIMAAVGPLKNSFVGELSRVLRDAINPFTTVRVPSCESAYQDLIDWLEEYADRPQHRAVLHSQREVVYSSTPLHHATGAPDPSACAARMVPTYCDRVYIKHGGYTIGVLRRRVTADGSLNAENAAVGGELVLTVFSRTAEPIERLCAEAQRLAQEKQNAWTCVYDYNGYRGEWKLMQRVPRYDVSQSKHDPRLLRDIFNDIELFRVRRQRYAEAGVRYKRGILLYGPPGSGKSTLIRVIASHFRMNVALMNEPGVFGPGHAAKMASAPANSLLVFEDIDRTRVAKDTSEQCADMLNALDGLTSASTGNIVVFTANSIARLPQALLRAGRMDRRFRIAEPVRQQCLAFYCSAFASAAGERPILDIDQSRFDFSGVPSDVMFEAEAFAHRVIEARLSCADIEGLLTRAGERECVSLVLDQELAERRALADDAGQEHAAALLEQNDALAALAGQFDRLLASRRHSPSSQLPPPS
jgi:hypothetical protein